MPRRRAFLAILLTLAWCAVAWHVDLEGAGLLLEHQHHAHDHGAHGHHGTHGDEGAHDDHDPFLVRDVVQDGQIRVAAAGLICVALLGGILANAIDPAGDSGQREPVPFGGWTAPPGRKVWQFVQRCAPAAAAPPLSR